MQVEKQRASWAQLHSELVAATPETSITLDDLTWALQCVRSRAFSGPYGGADAQGLASGLRPWIPATEHNFYPAGTCRSWQMHAEPS